LVTIFGGSGFVGRYIARRIAKQGWRVRVAVRRPNEALFVKSYGAVGQVEPVFLQYPRRWQRESRFGKRRRRSELCRNV